MRRERGFGLRAAFGVLLVGLGASAIAASLPELQQLFFALSRPFHFGAPPQPLAIGGTVLVLVGLAVVLVRVLRGGRTPLWAMALVLVGVVLPASGLLSEVPQGRSAAAADGVILDVGNALRRVMVDRLRKEGTVPADLDAWQRALEEVQGQTPSPVRDRRFERVPLRVIGREEGSGVLIPGTYWLWTSPQRDAFELHPVGFDTEGRPAGLTDSAGSPVILRGGARQESWPRELPGRGL